MNSEKTKIDEYTPKIIANWNEMASKTKTFKQPTPARAMTQSFIIDRDVLSEDMIRRELGRVRDEFLQEAKKLEVEKIAHLEMQLKEKYEMEFKKKADELARAARIINIQNAILQRLYEEDKETLIKILRDADISDDDLKILSAKSDG